MIHVTIPNQVGVTAARGAMAVAEIVVSTAVHVAKFGDRVFSYTVNKFWPIEIRSL